MIDLAAQVEVPKVDGQTFYLRQLSLYLLIVNVEGHYVHTLWWTQVDGGRRSVEISTAVELALLLVSKKLPDKKKVTFTFGQLWRPTEKLGFRVRKLCFFFSSSFLSFFYCSSRESNLKICSDFLFLTQSCDFFSKSCDFFVNILQCFLSQFFLSFFLPSFSSSLRESGAGVWLPGVPSG